MIGYLVALSFVGYFFAIFCNARLGSHFSGLCLVFKDCDYVMCMGGRHVCVVFRYVLSEKVFVNIHYSIT